MESKTKLINLTPHKITIVGEDGEVRARIPPSGKVARVVTEQTLIGYVENIPVVKTNFGDIEGIPHVCDNCDYDCYVRYDSDGVGEVDPSYAKLIDDLRCMGQRPVRYYIVSSLVAQALAGKRNDLLAPDTSPQGVVRDEEGRIVGVKRFQRW